MDVGVSRIVPPEAMTTAVFDMMGQNRDKPRRSLESKGASIAETIRSTAEANLRQDRGVRPEPRPGDLEVARR